MNNPDQGFEAYLSHPDLGGETAEGTIHLEARRLLFESAAISIEIPFECLRIQYDPDSGQISFIDRDRREVTCFTSDEDILDHWALLRSNHTRQQIRRIKVRDDTSRRVKLTLYALASCVVLIWVGSFVYDAIVASVVKQIPREWERQFGDKALAEERKEKESIFLDDTNREAQLAVLVEPLLRVVHAGSNEFRFHLVEDPEPNAMSLPGGNVIVTTGLLEMTDQAEELLGVFAHEFAHERKRHVFQEWLSAGGPWLVLQILMSDRNGRLNLMSDISGVLIMQSFSQKHEREADDVGFDYLVAANVNPHGMIEALTKLKVGEGFNPGALEAFSSHPATEKRIRHLQARWDKLPRKTGFLTVTNPVAPLTLSESVPHFENVLKKLPKTNSR